jgi:hypothetical protein
VIKPTFSRVAFQAKLFEGFGISFSLLSIKGRDGFASKGNSRLLKQFDSIELREVTDTTSLDSSKVTEDVYVGLRSNTPTNSDARSLETLGARTCDQNIGCVNIFNVLERADRLVVEHFICFINQSSTSRLTCSVNEVFKLSSLLRVASRVAWIREKSHSVLALNVISVRWFELILFIRLDDFVFATESVHHCVVGRVLSLSDSDGHVSS